MAEDEKWLAGDAPPPKGVMFGHDSRLHAAHPTIKYKGRYRPPEFGGKDGYLKIVPDVWAVEGEIQVLWCCPRCNNQFMLYSSKGRIEWDGTYLSMESFKCAYELGLRGDERISFGLNVCGAKIAVERNIAKDDD